MEEKKFKSKFNLPISLENTFQDKYRTYQELSVEIKHRKTKHETHTPTHTQTTNTNIRLIQITMALS